MKVFNQDVFSHVIDDSFSKLKEPELRRMTHLWLLRPPKYHLLKFDVKQSLSDTTLACLARYGKILSENGKTIFSMIGSNDLRKRIEELKLSEYLNILNSDDKCDKNGQEKILLHVFSEYFGDAISNTFEIQFDIPVRQTHRTDDGKGFPMGNNIAHMNFTLGSSSVDLVIQLDRAMLISLKRQIFGEEEADENPDQGDCILEVLNIVYGRFKSQLSRAGYTAPMAFGKLVDRESIKEILSSPTLHSLFFLSSNGKIKLNFLITS